MVNSVLIASDFVSNIPSNLSPANSNDRNGYIHVLSVDGDVEQSEIRIILRDFTDEGFMNKKKFLERLVSLEKKKFPKSNISLDIKDTYYNMKKYIDEYPPVMNNLLEAFHIEDIRARIKGIRGGTDGSFLSADGLPCPNIFTGTRMMHSRSEWVAVDDMVSCAKLLRTLIMTWAKNSTTLLSES